MTAEEQDINELKISNAALTQRVNFLEKTVYWFIGFVALNLIGSFFLWLSTFRK